MRELAIEHGLFTTEEHRRFTEWAESIGPIGGSRLVAKASDRSGFQGPRPGRWSSGLQGNRHRLDATDGIRHPQRLHASLRAGKYADPASRDRLHALLVLSPSFARHVARMVSHDELPAQNCPLATPESLRNLV